MRPSMALIHQEAHYCQAKHPTPSQSKKCVLHTRSLPSTTWNFLGLSPQHLHRPPPDAKSLGKQAAWLIIRIFCYPHHCSVRIFLQANARQWGCETKSLLSRSPYMMRRRENGGWLTTWLHVCSLSLMVCVALSLLLFSNASDTWLCFSYTLSSPPGRRRKSRRTRR